MMAISTTSSAQQNKKSNNEDPIALFLEFQFEAEDMDFAIELLTEVQNQTIENEEGCIAYDILLNDDSPIQSICMNATKTRQPSMFITMLLITKTLSISSYLHLLKIEGC